VQPVTKVIQHDAAVAAEHADRPGVPYGLDVLEPQFLAPVPGGRLEAEVFRRRARGEQDDRAAAGPTPAS